MGKMLSIGTGNTCCLHCISMMEYLINDWFCPRVNRNAFVMKQSRQSHECTLHSPQRLGKEFLILDECFFATNSFNNEFSCLIPGLCDLQENSSRANAVQDDLIGAGGLTQPNENKIIFFCSPKQHEWTELSKSDQKERSKIFSLLGLWYNMLENMTWHRTQRRNSMIGSCCPLFIVHALCSRASSDLAVGNACIRGRTNQIWKTKRNGCKNELVVHLNMNAASLTLCQQWFQLIILMPSLKKTKLPINNPKHTKLRIDYRIICRTINLFCRTIDLHSAAHFPIFGRNPVRSPVKGLFLEHCFLSM